MSKYKKKPKAPKWQRFILALLALIVLLNLINILMEIKLTFSLWQLKFIISTIIFVSIVLYAAFYGNFPNFILTIFYLRRKYRHKWRALWRR